MSSHKVPVTFLDGHSSRRGALGVITVPDALDESTPFCRVFSYAGQWGRCQDDLKFNCRSITYLNDERSGYKAWWVLGRNGEAVEIKAGVPRVEQISGAGLNVESAQRYGYVSAIKNIAGELYVCGYGRQAYKRDPAWRSIAGDILTHEPALGFFDMDGTGPSCIYAVGWKGEIYLYDSKVWLRDDSPTTVHLASVRCLKDDDIWICGNNGLVLHGSFNNWQVIRDDSLIGNWYSIEEFAGSVYVASNTQLARIEGSSIIPLDIGLNRPLTTHRLHAKDGMLWSIGAKDVLAFDGQHWTEVVHPDNV